MLKLFNVVNIDEINHQITKFIEKNLKIIEIDLKDSVGYILAMDIDAREDTPQFYKSTVDGYAVMIQDTLGATDSTPSALKYQGSIEIGVNNTYTLESGSCMYLNTGSMLPDGANGVVMIERTEMVEETKEVLVYQTLANHENVSIPGTDITKKQLLFKKDQVIDARVQAVLASQGISKIMVYQKLEAIIISSGNELVSYDSQIAMGQIRDINIFLIKGLLQEYGIIVKETFLIKDDFTTYSDILKKNEANLYLTSGGSSQGKEDYTYDVFHQLTNNVLCHGLAIKPGKPTIVAAQDDRLYLGLPGNPVSAYLVLKETLIASYLATTKQKQNTIKALLAHNMAGAPGKDSIILVKVEKHLNTMVAKPVFYRSSNVLALSEADGYFVIREGLEGIDENEEVEVILF